jgi:AraC family transcriptional regulator
MIRAEQLISSRYLSIARFDHEPEAPHQDPEEEISSDYAINFVESGAFRLSAKDHSYNLSAGHVFFSQPGALRRYQHDLAVPCDVCLSVVYSADFGRNLFASDESSNVRVAVSPTNRLRFLKWRLTEAANDQNHFALEAIASDLAFAIRNGPSNSKPLYREPQLRWYAERVEAVRKLFETRYAEDHSLVALARSVGMSTFQFARVFSELEGVPPHRHLLRVRLDKAAGMLRDGVSVTQSCFDVGFSNLSHFTRSFRKRFGCLPSSYRMSHE